MRESPNVNILFLCYPKWSALPTIFTRELKDQKALEKESVTWSCELSKPGMPVQWRKGDVDLFSCAKYEFRQDGHLVQLIIHDLNTEDSGYYTCDSGDQKTTAHLEVKGKNLISYKGWHGRFFIYLNLISWLCRITHCV